MPSPVESRRPESESSPSPHVSSPSPSPNPDVKDSSPSPARSGLESDSSPSPRTRVPISGHYRFFFTYRSYVSTGGGKAEPDLESLELRILEEERKMTPAQLLIANEFVSTPGFSGIPGSIETPVDDKE